MRAQGGANLGPKLASDLKLVCERDLRTRKSDRKEQNWPLRSVHVLLHFLIFSINFWFFKTVETPKTPMLIAMKLLSNYSTVVYIVISFFQSTVHEFIRIFICMQFLFLLHTVPVFAFFFPDFVRVRW